MALFYFIILDLLYMYKASSWYSSWDEDSKPSHTILSLKIFYTSCVYLQHVAVTYMVRSVKNSVVTVATRNHVITWTEPVHPDVRLVRMVQRVKNHVVTVATGIHVIT